MQYGCSLFRQALYACLVMLALVWTIQLARAQPATAPSTSFSLPPVPNDESSLAGLERVQVHEFRFDGNTAISSKELLAEAVRASGWLPDQTLSLNQLEQIRQALTNLYISRGYTTSGVLLPDQDVTNHVVTYQIVEGTLARIHWIFQGSGLAMWLHPSSRYLDARVKTGLKKSLNTNALRERLDRLRQNASIARLNAELKPDQTLGKSVLDVSVLPAPPVWLALDFNNHHPPSTGAERFEALGDIRNLTGWGDVFSFDYGITEGGFDSMKLSGSDNFSLNYAIPVTPIDTTIIADVQRTDDALVESDLSSLDIVSDSWSYSLTVRQPVYRRTQQELAVFLAGSYRTNATELSGEPFSFSAGAIEGRTKVTAVRFGAEYSYSGSVNAVSARSTFSVGTNWLNATDHDSTLPDSQFFAWLQQVQFAHKLGQSDNQLVLREQGQLSSDRLPDLEQFAIGGVNTVRGYRENRLVRDNGIVGSAELHVPIVPPRNGISMLELVPFLDVGYGRDNKANPHDERNFLASSGIGILFRPDEHLTTSVYYGYPFERFSERGNLQDIGIHFEISLGISF